MSEEATKTNATVSMEQLNELGSYVQEAKKTLLDNGYEVSEKATWTQILTMYDGYRNSLAEKNSAQQNTPPRISQSPQSNDGNSSEGGGLFDMLGKAFANAFERALEIQLTHAMLHQDCIHAGCHGPHPCLSYGLPPYMADHHNRFCHHVDGRMGANAALTMDGANRLDHGLGQLNDGNSSNNASGIVNTVVGGLETLGGLAGTIKSLTNRDSRGEPPHHHPEPHHSHTPQLNALARREMMHRRGRC